MIAIIIEYVIRLVDYKHKSIFSILKIKFILNNLFNFICMGKQQK